MKRRPYPAIINMTREWVDSLNHVQCEYAPGKWGPARPLAFEGLFGRLHAAWAVYTGRADALVWPGQDGAIRWNR